MKYIEKQILNDLSKKLKLKDKILLYIFKKYSYNIYRKGFQDGFDFRK